MIIFVCCLHFTYELYFPLLLHFLLTDFECSSDSKVLSSEEKQILKYTIQPLAYCVFFSPLKRMTW